MRLRSVNVSPVREFEKDGKVWRTAIYKEPVEGRRHVGRLSVDGDEQANLQVHGGPEKAVYAYPFEHYADWSNDYDGQSFPPGHFGENLTLEGLSEHEVRAGDRLRIGTAEFVVTTPRQPCAKFAMKMGGPEAVRRMWETGRCGFYLSVASEGEIGAGDLVEHSPGNDPKAPTIAAVFAAKAPKTLK
ncbi:MAG: MOSC domain-containing protein [bacterium]